MNHNIEQLTPAEQDTRRLDWLDNKGGDWIARDSEHGRGYRLHQTTRDNSYQTARMAIDAAMHVEMSDLMHQIEHSANVIVQDTRSGTGNFIELLPVENVPEYKLCYIEGDTAYFTTQALKLQWGDDWDDAPYEHNAGTPYGPSISYFVDGREEKNPLDWNEDGTPKFSLYHLKFTAWRLETPADNVHNSRYSVKDINAGAVAWLRGNLDDGTPIAIPAGASIDEFKQTVRLAGGTIYLPEIV